VQAGVEPLRRVRRHHLHRQHVAVLVEKGAGVGLGIEVAALPAPIGPGAGQPVEYLLGLNGSPVRRSFSPSSLRAASSATERHSQDGTVSSSTFLQAGRHPRLAEILLRPAHRRQPATTRPATFHVIGMKDHRAIRIADFRFVVRRNAMSA